MSQFDRNELQTLHSHFNKLAKSGSLDRDSFAVALNQFLPTQPPNIVDPTIRIKQIEDLFTAFDRNNSGTVDFGEFASGLSVLLSGSEAEKITFAFALLDVNGDGNISFDEMTNYFRTYLLSQHKIHQSNLTPERWELFKSHLKRGFDAADLDKNGTISLSEFEKAIRDPDHPLAVIIDYVNSYRKLH